MTDYKHTLNLPSTAFPMKANLSQREPEALARWQSSNLYAAIRQEHAGKPRFILHDGPPYANGHLHCGHALNKILKDMIVKSKSFSGFDAPFIPGWDCHGLPIELNVEKKEGKAGEKLSADAFRKKCREYAASQIDIQRDEFQRLGVLGDWYNPYVTMSYTYEANIVRALGVLIERGYLQQGFKPVHWCVECGSALAEAEVDYEEKRSHSIDVAFDAVAPADWLKRLNITLMEKPITVPIWTTTPWTLPANEAVCLHPTLDYVFVDAGERYFLIAQALVVDTMKRYGLEAYNVVASCEGALFEHLTLQHPFNPRHVPIVLGEHVTIDAGTGCVHTAPAHGPDDYAVGLKYNLPLINPVLSNGCFASNAPFFAGQFVLKSNEAVITLLEQHAKLLHNTMLLHSYPHCWRHKTPMIFRATPQWFVSMEAGGLREALLEQVEKVRWVPDWGKSRIHSMIKNRPDWCISRQRNWSTPMPLFLHKETRALHPRTLEWIHRIADKIQENGIEAWFNLDAQTWLGDDADHYEKASDTLDVWFDSGVSHYAVLSQQGMFPADIYFEGSDQHRGWFNSSLTTSVAMQGTPPYKTVLTHGYVVDAEGRKLSKSKGNYVDLDKLIKQHGADILRLWVASTDYRNEVSISDEIIKRNADAYRRIRNTARFLLANLFDFDPAINQVSGDKLIALDRWAIARTQALQQEICAAYEAYHFHVIYQKIHNFCAVDMGSFYLDIIKDRQYTTAVNSIARRSCQTAMYHIITAFARWLAPIISFTADEIWSCIPGNKSSSIFLESWHQAWPIFPAVNMEQWELLQLVRTEVNKALELKRQEGVIGSGLEAEVIIYADEPLFSILLALGNELRFLLITSAAHVRPLAECGDNAWMNKEMGLALNVSVLTTEKCERCWHRTPDVGTHNTHPTLCGRCISNISGDNEIRSFA